jgi:long-chain acyl-CoA synthetase
MHRPWLAHYPAGVGVDIDVARYDSLVALLNDAFSRYAERPALRFLGASITYAQVDEASSAFAAYLARSGVNRGDRVAIMLPNLPQLAVAAAGALRAGAVVVNLDAQLEPAALEQQLRDSGARVIVAQRRDGERLQRCAQVKHAKAVVLTAPGDMIGVARRAVSGSALRQLEGEVPPFELPAAMRFNAALAAGRGRAFTPPRLSSDDLALLQYSGGTTGPCKAAVLLHCNLVANVLQAGAWLQPALARVAAGEQPQAACAVPLQRLYGFTAHLLLSLHIGACQLLTGNVDDPAALLRGLLRRRVHLLSAEADGFEALLSHPDFERVDWSDLVLCAGACSPMPARTAERWAARTGRAICEGYGLCETGGLAVCQPVAGRAFAGSVGLPLPGTDVRLLDDAGAEVAPGQPGEVAIKGPQVMAGYWQRPELTARVMTPDGYLRTGDIGTMDARGALRIVDRKRDLIVVAGYAVFPTEVEAALGRMPGVRECAAVGVTDAQQGEAVKLVIVRGDEAVDESDVRAYCARHLTRHAQPRIVEFRDGLPRSRLGRVLRRELRT